MAEENATSSELKESKLLYWEVYNFMSLTHAKIEFDEQGIVNILGYNGSGKSSSLRALEVNMYNRYPQSQLSFIQSGKDYFRVMSVWSDGVVIIKDKYLNGQGLYEMWKGDKCLYSSKQNGVLTKIADVPACIQEYLNLVKLDDGYLNSRSCFEKQFLAQTTGSENYSSLNIILKSEELSMAGSLVNADRNKLASDISVADTELSVLRGQYKEGIEITEELIATLKSHDELLDLCEQQLSSVGSVVSASEKIAEIADIPQLYQVDTNQLALLDAILTDIEQLKSIKDIPALKTVSTEQLDLINTLVSSEKQLQGIPDLPVVRSVNSEELDALETVIRCIATFKDNEVEISNINTQLIKLDKESKDIEARIKDYGIKTVRCKNCGALVEVGGDGDAEQCCNRG